MADNTPIEWTDATWNPITGCTRVDNGCQNCYAEIMAARFSKPGQWGHGLAKMVITPDGKTDHRWTGQVSFNDKILPQPLRWKRPRRIFVNSTSDMFHPSVPDEWVDRVFAVMALSPRHTFQVLTKRPDRMRTYIAANIGMTTRANWVTTAISRQTGMGVVRPFDWPLKNVWLGTSISDQASAEARIPHLLNTPAAVRFLSAEPLLGPVDLSHWMGVHHSRDNNMADPETRSAINTMIRLARDQFRAEHGNHGLNWIITGGESGPGARPMHPDWARSLRDQCEAAGVAFFFKQWGEWAPAVHDPDHDGHVLRQTEATGPFNSWKANVYDPDRLEGVNWRKLGKKAAGRLLDGREHNDMPGVQG